MSSETKDWVTVSSKSGKTKEGFPVGEILCRSLKDIDQVIKDMDIIDPVVKPYIPEYGINLTMEEVQCIEYSLKYTMDSLKLDQVEKDTLNRVIYKLKCLRM